MRRKQMAVLFAAAALMLGMAGCAQEGKTEAQSQAGTEAAGTGAPAAEPGQGTQAQPGEPVLGEGEEENYDTGDASMDNARNQDGIGEKELLVVSFGTSFNDNRRMTIGAIEDAVEKAFPDYSVRRGFTSQIIIDHVKSRDQVSIDNVGEALDRAVNNGVKTLVVQPTHLMNGLEYADLVKELAEYSDAFDQIAVGEPLLTSDRDFQEVIQAITEATAEYDDGETAICFMGHGTEAESNQVYRKLQGMLAEAGYDHYYVGTVEAEPTLEDVLGEIRKGAYQRVVLEPLMIVAGDHANNDMAGDGEDSWKTVFENAGYEVTCILRGLGELESIQQMFVEHARAAAEPSQEKQKDGRQAARSMELRYAQQFSVEYLSDGNALVTIQDTGKYLVVAEGGQVPGDLPGEITVIRKPVKQIYLAATSAMDLFCSLEGIDTVTLSGTDASGWYIPEARKAMEAGDMVYAGKYNAPDYERILAQGCDLAIESTMITHSPEVKEQLEALGIPVLVERSSYESHPLGRMEWLKLYGLLLDREALADQCLERQRERLEPVMGQEPTGRTVAFFYITSNGSVNVRRPGDYVAKLIHLAGGTYVPGGLDEADNAQSTMDMQMEAFYGAAKDADVLIYNGAIDQAPGTREELLAKSPLLADFRGVKEGRVWCTEKNLFQETMGLGELLLDIHRVVTEERPDPEEMTYLKLLQ